MSITEKLLETLDEITGTGKFSTEGKTKFFFPEIHVDDEELAFPIPPSQVKHLISLAEDAPYGMGEETVLNKEVRKCWQIDAGQLNFPSKGKWTKYLSSILKDVAEEMGVTGEIFTDPYKLLIYEEGGHFLPHQDTEKIPGMFGTLIIALPSKHKGGALCVRHNNKEVIVRFDSDSMTRHFQHIAFFADCEHEVKKVTDGYRVCLVFNLALKKTTTKELNPDTSIYTEQLIPILEELKPGLKGELKAILLSHQYTPEQFALKTLKNEDFTKAKALIEAAKSVGYDAYLGLVTLHQSGELEGGGYDEYRNRHGPYRDDYDDDERDSSNGEMGEIYEETLSVQLSDGSHSLGNYQIQTCALLPETKLDTGDPDEKESEGYTGNAGCTMEHWYHRAAVVIWPKQSSAAIMCKYDLRGAARTFQNFKSLKLSVSAAETLGLEIIKNISDERESYSYGGVPINELFQGIAALKSEKMLLQCLQKYDHETLSKIDEASWKKLFTVFADGLFQEHFKSIPVSFIEKSAGSFLSALHALLEKNQTTGLIKVLTPYVTIHNFHGSISYRYRAEYKKADSIHLMLACSAYTADKAMREKLLKSILWELDLDYIRTDLSNALLATKHLSHLKKETSYFQTVLTTTYQRLEEEINRPLLPYSDFSRPYIKHRTGGYYSRYNTKNSADYYSQLEKFCLCPDEQTLEIKANAEFRNALEAHIKEVDLDFFCRTIKKGSPHILHLTKNDKSYHRAVKQREADKKLLSKLSNQK